ncbi:hypothetical protein QBC37DRAFT_432834 [Rhypophila decipiens]|uniref:Uncharacterized protein n=1 Tax=Rhypophila decipiens TaxID=261697 RepID=A0AAN7B053_9PEZI|nr:hypothetical protein QBC37DRAFT_432834 [Rhypophila decipiens]
MGLNTADDDGDDRLVTSMQSLQIPDIPYMYTPPDLKDKKPICQADGKCHGPLPITEYESRLDERWKDFLITGQGMSSFAYAERVKIIQDLRAAWRSLHLELQTIISAEEQQWKTWDENQKALAEWSVDLRSPTHPFEPLLRLKIRWARLRYRWSDRRLFASETHRASLRTKCHSLRAKWTSLWEGAKQQLQELDGKEAVLRRERRGRSRMEKIWDPDCMRRAEIIGNIRNIEVVRMKSVLQGCQCCKETKKEKVPMETIIS